MAAPARSVDSTRPPAAVGIALVVISTVSIAIVPILAKFAYDGGSNTLTVITGRSLVSVLLTVGVVAILRLPFRINRRAATLSVLTGVLYGGVLYGYLGAVNYLPVNLVILIYFVHPLLVGVTGAMFGLERVTLPMVAVLTVALIGLTFAVGASVAALDSYGIFLAATAMILTVFVILGNAAAAKTAPAMSVCLYMLAAAAVSLGVPLLFTGSLSWPVTGQGWFGLVGVAVLFTVGTLTFFAAVSIIGATRAAMISNLEPVLGVLFALIVLGERLTVLQAIGVVLVVGSIYAMEKLRGRSEPQSVPGPAET